MEDQNGRIRELEAALARKTALVREVDHRAKNDLQLISSLMLLQSRRIGDETARLALRTMLERVNAVAAAHRRLLESESAGNLDLADLVRDLTAELALAAGRDDVRIELDLRTVAMPSRSAAPLALVLNELVGNALKHAFPANAGGAIHIRVDGADNGWELTVSDDGQGMGEGPNGFGLTVVGLLCRQLRAEFQIAAANPGVRAVVRTAPDPAQVP